MSERLTTLEAWAAKRYGEHAPSIHTLRRWVREAKIMPVPKKHGRKYFVPLSATVVPGKQIQAKLRPHQTSDCNVWRRLSKINRVPRWADRKHIQTMYRAAWRVSQCTGIQFHVDHIYPVRGRLVSGLHVGHNLRVITAVANFSKNNRFRGDV